MIWQDPALMAINYIFAATLIPQAFDMYHNKMPMNKFTCLLTSVLLIAAGAIFITLNLWLSMTAELVNAVIWGAMLYMSYRNGRGNNNIKMRERISHPSWL